MIWPSRPSSRVSISILPEVEEARASRSVMRGTTSVSPRRSARRVALATSTSMLATVRRTDTPEDWFTWGLSRASWESVATTSAMNSGTSTRTPSTSKGRASCRAMATSVSTSSG